MPFTALRPLSQNPQSPESLNLYTPKPLRKQLNDLNDELDVTKMELGMMTSVRLPGSIP